jgi:uncharacterized protein (DUF1778 family)
VDKTLTGVQPCGSLPIPQPEASETACSVRLSERDEAAVMAAAEKPPAPNEAALQAARRFIERHG